MLEKREQKRKEKETIKEQQRTRKERETRKEKNRKEKKYICCVHSPHKKRRPSAALPICASCSCTEEAANTPDMRIGITQGHLE